MAAFAGYVVLANNECPAPVALSDPFNDFDELMTEEEKRQAAHHDLEKKLAAHQSSCLPPSAMSTPTPSESQQSSEQASSQAANSQTSGEGAGQKGSSQSGDQSGSQSKPTQQSTPANGVSGEGPSGPSRQSAGQPSASQGQASQSTAGSAGASGGQPPPGTGTQIESQAASGVAGASPATHQPGTSAPQPPSEFLKTYGAQGPQSQETVEEIANRHKNSGQDPYGTPGNTGSTSKPNYSSPETMTHQSQTVSADAGLRKSLQERLANETDPDKRREIQAQIDELNE